MAAWMFFALVFLTQFAAQLYAVQKIELPISFEIASRVAYVWLAWLWLTSDSRKRRISWPMDLGYFLYIASIFILPFHLIKTRGWAGLIPILFVIALMLAGTALGSVIGIILHRPDGF